MLLKGGPDLDRLAIKERHSGEESGMSKGTEAGKGSVGASGHPQLAGAVAE